MKPHVHRWQYVGTWGRVTRLLGVARYRADWITRCDECGQVRASRLRGRPARDALAAAQAGPSS